MCQHQQPPPIPILIPKKLGISWRPKIKNAPPKVHKKRSSQDLLGFQTQIPAPSYSPMHSLLSFQLKNIYVHRLQNHSFSRVSLSMIRSLYPSTATFTHTLAIWAISTPALERPPTSLLFLGAVSGAVTMPPGLRIQALNVSGLASAISHRPFSASDFGFRGSPSESSDVDRDLLLQKTKLNLWPAGALGAMCSRRALAAASGKSTFTWWRAALLLFSWSGRPPIALYFDVVSVHVERSIKIHGIIK